MSPYVQRAAFLGNVKIGDRVRYQSGKHGFMTVTGRMDDELVFLDMTIVQLIGMYDDGSPAILEGKLSNPVVVEVPIEVEQDGAR